MLLFDVQQEYSFKVMVNVVYAAEPSEVSFLFFLFYIASAGNLDQLIEAIGGAQDSKLKGKSIVYLICKVAHNKCR